MVSATEGWAVGPSEILHYANGVWTLTQIAYTLVSVSMDSANDGWAVGPDIIAHLHDDARIVRVGDGGNDAGPRNRRVPVGLDCEHQAAAGDATVEFEHDASGVRIGGVGIGCEQCRQLRTRAAALARLFADMSPAERIARLRREITGRIVFTTSFGLEDQAILHLLAEQDGDIDVVTLDTGRLFPETYVLWAQVERRYGRRIRAVHPRHGDLEALVERHGINGFYDSRAARMACCAVRKVEPLNRALADARAWIAGLRADQSAHRQDMALVSADLDRGLIKLNPLFDWTREELVDFVSANDIPVNPLHAKGFASIGCAPCTRAIAPGEPERAGRWWWEDESKKECGLHTRRL